MISSRLVAKCEPGQLPDAILQRKTLSPRHWHIMCGMNHDGSHPKFLHQGHLMKYPIIPLTVLLLVGVMNGLPIIAQTANAPSSSSTLPDNGGVPPHSTNAPPSDGSQGYSSTLPDHGGVPPAVPPKTPGFAPTIPPTKPPPSPTTPPSPTAPAAPTTH